MTDDELKALTAKIERQLQSWSLICAMVGFGLGGILGTLYLGVLAGIALSVFCAPLAYATFLLVAWARPALFAPKVGEGKP